MSESLEVSAAWEISRTLDHWAAGMLELSSGGPHIICNWDETLKRAESLEAAICVIACLRTTPRAKRQRAKARQYRWSNVVKTPAGRVSVSLHPPTAAVPGEIEGFTLYAGKRGEGIVQTYVDRNNPQFSDLLDFAMRAAQVGVAQVP